MSLSRNESETGYEMHKKMRKSRRRNGMFHSGSTRTTPIKPHDAAPVDGLFIGNVLQFETVEAKHE